MLLLLLQETQGRVYIQVGWLCENYRGTDQSLKQLKTQKQALMMKLSKLNIQTFKETTQF